MRLVISHLWYINVGVVIEAYLVVGGVVGVHDLEAPVEGDQVPLLHLEERLKCELFKRQKCNMFRDMLHLPLGEQALAPLLHLRAKHLAPAALVRIRHLVSSVTDAARTSRMRVISRFTLELCIEILIKPPVDAVLDPRLPSPQTGGWVQRHGQEWEQGPPAPRLHQAPKIRIFSMFEKQN